MTAFHLVVSLQESVQPLRSLGFQFIDMITRTPNNAKRSLNFTTFSMVESQILAAETASKSRHPLYSLVKVRAFDDETSFISAFVACPS